MAAGPEHHGNYMVPRELEDELIESSSILEAFDDRALAGLRNWLGEDRNQIAAIQDGIASVFDLPLLKNIARIGWCDVEFATFIHNVSSGRKLFSL